jgi:hypothetical protein
VGNGWRRQARWVLLHQVAPAYQQSSGSEKHCSERTHALAIRLILASASREQAKVGDHRSVRGCSAWNLLLAMLFMQCQGSPRAIQRLCRDGCHLDRLCCESMPCWGVVPVEGGAVTALGAAAEATPRKAKSVWLSTSRSSRSPHRLPLTLYLSSQSLGERCFDQPR